jgi:phenylpyruvate tautomerase PptA (4-oxalocrotonate tautomerase family)
MPLIEIDALPQPAEVDPAAVTRELNQAISTALGCRLEAVWTVWRTITGPYARGADVSLEQHRDTHGPIVHVYHHRTPEEVARVVETIERVLAHALSLGPGNVFVTVQPVEFVERSG